MVLVLQDDDQAAFSILSRIRLEEGPSFTLRAWRTEAVEKIEADSDTVSDMAANAVTRGVPIPLDDYVFGWKRGEDITALVMFYTTYEPAYPEPSWAVMPLAGIPEAQWPPFTVERFFGHWFWEDHWTGSIVSVDDLIAETPDTVFWVGTRAILGSDCCVVAHDIRGAEGTTLRRGRYLYHEALREVGSVPSLAVLLADPDKVDLAPRLGRSNPDDSSPRR
jgi:hypothetical protein